MTHTPNTPLRLSIHFVTGGAMASHLHNSGARTTLFEFSAVTLNNHQSTDFISYQHMVPITT